MEKQKIPDKLEDRLNYFFSFKDNWYGNEIGQFFKDCTNFPDRFSKYCRPVIIENLLTKKKDKMFQLKYKL